MASYGNENAFNISLDVMDAQHAKILDYMNSIFNDFVDNNSKNDLFNAMLDRLEILCQLHFFEEDNLMEIVGYPLAAGQKHPHDSFLTSIDSIRSCTYKHHSSSMLNDLIVLRKNFRSHVENESVPLGEFINGHKRLTISAQAW